ncbi:MAG: hypothetical protein JWN57_864 [Frankiales bacterium]|nr:hypothetical protein [Frankiales bacterium]
MLDVLFSTTRAVQVAVALAVLTGLLWFLPPAARTVRRQREGGDCRPPRTSGSRTARRRSGA